jgi:hypothetical protein
MENELPQGSLAFDGAPLDANATLSVSDAVDDVEGTLALLIERGLVAGLFRHKQGIMALHPTNPFPTGIAL